MSCKQLFPLFLIFSVFTAAILSLTVFSTESTVVSTDPEYAYASAYQSFTVNITVSSVTNLNNWQVKLGFNPHIISCTEVFIPNDNIFSGHTTIFPSPEIDNVVGSLRAFHGIWGDESVTGSGKLCSVTFQTLSPGISALSFLGGTYLKDPENLDIPFESNDGVIQVNGAGFNLHIFEVVQNEITYNVTVFSNSSITDFQFNHAQQRMSFYASGVQGTTGSCTTCIPKPLLNGTLAILADDYAVYYSMSTDASNQYHFFNYQHTATDVHVQVIETITCDINGDRKVDMKDIAIVARAFGSYPGHALWNPIADLTGPEGRPDGKVDMRDVALVARHFGEEY